MDQENYISIFDRPKRPRGRPKIFTDEQRKERNRLISKKHYDNDESDTMMKTRGIEKERGREGDME